MEVAYTEKRNQVGSFSFVPLSFPDITLKIVSTMSKQYFNNFGNADMGGDIESVSKNISESVSSLAERMIENGCSIVELRAMEQWVISTVTATLAGEILKAQVDMRRIRQEKANLDAPWQNQYLNPSPKILG